VLARPPGLGANGRALYALQAARHAPPHAPAKRGLHSARPSYVQTCSAPLLSSVSRQRSARRSRRSGSRRSKVVGALQLPAVYRWHWLGVATTSRP
jgi:hypothetical protein